MSQTGFQIQSWARASVSANEVLQTANNIVVGCFREYNYYSPVDTQATCSASGYFNNVAFDLITGDYIKIYSASEGSLVTYYVTNSQGVRSFFDRACYYLNSNWWKSNNLLGNNIDPIPWCICRPIVSVGRSRCGLSICERSRCHDLHVWVSTISCRWRKLSTVWFNRRWRRPACNQ